MSVFLKNGKTYQVSSKEAMDLHEALPAGNFLVKLDDRGNFFLEKVEDFNLGFKLYGDITHTTARALHTFETRPDSTGIMMVGEKGSGKTLLAKNICIQAAKGGVPTLIINAPFRGPTFNSFLQMMNQPTIIFIDEFEKLYGSPQDIGGSGSMQKDILTLLDGVFPSKKLFLLTCNDKYRVDSHMKNRPGRIFYMLDFSSISPEFIRQYCEDNLHEKAHIDRVVQLGGSFSKFNFDMLKALCEEMNRFKEPPVEALKMLNIRPEHEDGSLYSIEFYHKGTKLEASQILAPLSRQMTANPLITQYLYIEYHLTDKERDELEDEEYLTAHFEMKDIKNIEDGGRRVVYKNEEGNSLILQKKEVKTYSYRDLF